MVEPRKRVLIAIGAPLTALALLGGGVAFAQSQDTPETPGPATQDQAEPTPTAPSAEPSPTTPGGTAPDGMEDPNCPNMGGTGGGGRGPGGTAPGAAPDDTTGDPGTSTQTSARPRHRAVVGAQ
jgi:hypothetical protein